MRFDVVPSTGPDQHATVGLVLPALAPLGAATLARELSLNEQESATVKVSTEGGNIVLDCAGGEPFACRGEPRNAQPRRQRKAARMGRDRRPSSRSRRDRGLGALQLHRGRAPDPHPRDHVRGLEPPAVRRRRPPPESWELGRKDTVIAHAREGALRPRRPLRLALPHRRARGQRDDAAVSHRALALPNSVLALVQRYGVTPTEKRRFTRRPLLRMESGWFT